MIKSLQCYRALAALLVVLSHSPDLMARYFEHHAIYESLWGFGRSGVQFFFVLSGFIIFHVHRKEGADPRGVKRYIGKRVNRILPLYWLITIILTAVIFAVPSFGEDYHRSLYALFASLFLIPQDHLPHLVIGWTLVHEAFFYVFFLLFFFTKRFSAAAIVWAALIGLHILFPSSNWLVDFFLNPNNLLFLCGMLIAAKIDFLRKHTRATTLLLLGIAGYVSGALLVASGFIDASAAYKNLAFILWFGGSSALLVASSAAGGIEKYFEGKRILHFLGAASYSIYLTHLPVMSATGKLLSKLEQSVSIPNLLCAAIIVITAIVAGSLCHVFVEKPMLEVGARLLGLRKTNGPGIEPALGSPLVIPSR